MADSETVVEAFTQLAPSYEETVDRELRDFLGLGYQQFIDRLVSLTAISERDTVLDVATGTALIPISVADMLGAEGQAVGLDITPAMLRYAQDNVEASDLASRVSLVCASGLEIPFVENTFDVVICGLGTHHMDVPRMLREMRRVLKRGGRLLLADVGASPSWRSWWGKVTLGLLLVRYSLTQSRERTRAELDAYSNVRTLAEWRTLLSESVFAGVEIDELRGRRMWYPHAFIIRATAA
jgi:ubiquinone/menaquinone biosynthesis C-methylase UbiE